SSSASLLPSTRAFSCLTSPPPPSSTLFPYTTLFRSYGEHKDRPFFGELVDFITSAPVFAMVWEGEGVIKIARDMMGSTNPQEAATGTIRGDFGMTVGKNVIHGSDSPESAEREINLFFDEKEVLSYSKNDSAWVY